jgi:hypothetical protein
MISMMFDTVSPTMAAVALPADVKESTFRAVAKTVRSFENIRGAHLGAARCMWTAKGECRFS